MLTPEVHAETVTPQQGPQHLLGLREIAPQDLRTFCVSIDDCIGVPTPVEPPISVPPLVLLPGKRGDSTPATS